MAIIGSAVAAFIINFTVTASAVISLRYLIGQY